MPSPDFEPRVLRGEYDSSFRISNIRSDTNIAASLAIVVDDGGNVGISIVDPESGIVGIDLYPFQGGGANSEITVLFRNFARELADLIESGEK